MCSQSLILGHHFQVACVEVFGFYGQNYLIFWNFRFINYINILVRKFIWYLDKSSEKSGTSDLTNVIQSSPLQFYRSSIPKALVADEMCAKHISEDSETMGCSDTVHVRPLALGDGVVRMVSVYNNHHKTFLRPSLKGLMSVLAIMILLRLDFLKSFYQSVSLGAVLCCVSKKTKYYWNRTWGIGSVYNQYPQGNSPSNICRTISLNVKVCTSNAIYRNLLHHSLSNLICVQLMMDDVLKDWSMSKPFEQFFNYLKAHVYGMVTVAAV